jgi:adenosylmethionine-8-amino-7-oxononanoate aminotransferase
MTVNDDDHDDRDDRDDQHQSLDELQANARRHLWMHFSQLGQFRERDIPLIMRGEGCYVWDQHGDRKLDGLSGLFTVQIGHGRRRLAHAAAKQAGTLEYFPLWSYAHPPAIELATKLAELAPDDLNRVFFTTGGSDAVETSWKLARQYFRAIGQPQRYKVIARRTAYHGTTMGALALTGVPSFRAPFEPMTPGGEHVMNTNSFRHPMAKDEHAFMMLTTEAIEEAIAFEGPETVAAVILEPVQNAGGCIPPPEGYFQRVREICDRHGILLISDEVICAFGRLGRMFGAERYDYLPDMITTAKGLTSGYSPLGAVICRDFLAEPFIGAEPNSFMHGFTFGGHPVSCAVGMENLRVFEEEDILGNVERREPGFHERLTGLYDIPIVGDVRGAGYFWAIELVKDQQTGERFGKEEGTALLRGFVAPETFAAGLICRVDDRGDLVVQLAPPLVAGDTELDEIEAILRRVLTEAGTKVAV